MNCIRCRDAMKKLQVRGTLLDHCVPCNAIWLDGGELDSLERGWGAGADTLAAQHRAETEAEAARVVEVLNLCPRCQRRLEIASIGAVEIDRCAHCGGMFFDKGELQTVLRLIRRGLVARLWRRVRRLGRRRG
jgi:Zn-finger nucleic acid-binding protein